MNEMFPKMYEIKTFKVFFWICPDPSSDDFCWVMFVAKTNFVVHVTYILRGCLNEFIHPITTLKSCIMYIFHM